MMEPNATCRTVQRFASMLLLLLCTLHVAAQRSTVSAGGDLTGAQGTMSFSVGQVGYTTFSSGAGTVQPGVQQVYREREHIWTGAISTDWSVGGNWNTGTVPTASSNVAIGSEPVNQPHVTGSAAAPAVCADLSIDFLALLTVDAGKALTVNGDMILTGNILVKADANGIGSVITYGIKVGNGFCRMEQYLTGTNTAGTPDGVFYYVAPPVPAAQASIFGIAGGNRLWSANESTQSYPQITDGGTLLNAGRGYVVRMGDMTTVTYSDSDFNTGNVEIGALTRTGTTATNRGYNLVGNPYPSTVSWDNATRTNLETTLWYRTHQGSTMLYDTYNATGMIGTDNNGGGAVTGSIPPTQAFWVRVDADGNTGQLNFTNAMRSHGTLAGIYKVEAEEGTVRLTISNGSLSDEAIILFNENASDGFDDFDSRKFWATSSVPQLYTTLGADSMVINGLHSTATNPVVDLGMKLPAAAEYSINATSITMYGDVWLEDRLMYVFQNLNENPVYDFTAAQAGNIPTRFALHFGMLPVGVGRDALHGPYTQVYAYDNMVNVLMGEDILPGSVTIMDMMGRTVQTATLNGTSTVITTSVSTGIYIVRVETEKGVETRRVLLN